MATAPVMIGRRSTNRAHRTQPLAVAGTRSGDWSAPISASGAVIARSDLRSTRRPIFASSAGNNVTAAVTVRNTVNDAATAIPVRNPTLRMSMPSSAMMTVPPANSTARPEVFIAVVIAVVTSAPWRSAFRCRLTMNSA